MPWAIIGMVVTFILESCIFYISSGKIEKRITLLDGESFRVCLLLDTTSPVVTVQCWS